MYLNGKLVDFINRDLMALEDGLINEEAMTFTIDQQIPSFRVGEHCLLKGATQQYGEISLLVESTRTGQRKTRLNDLHSASQKFRDYYKALNKRIERDHMDDIEEALINSPIVSIKEHEEEEWNTW